MLAYAWVKKFHPYKLFNFRLIGEPPTILTSSHVQMTELTLWFWKTWNYITIRTSDLLLISASDSVALAFQEHFLFSLSGCVVQLHVERKFLHKYPRTECTWKISPTRRRSVFGELTNCQAIEFHFFTCSEVRPKFTKNCAYPFLLIYFRFKSTFGFIPFCFNVLCVGVNPVSVKSHKSLCRRR